MFREAPGHNHNHNTMAGAKRRLVNTKSTTNNGAVDHGFKFVKKRNDNIFGGAAAVAINCRGFGTLTATATLVAWCESTAIATRLGSRNVATSEHDCSGANIVMFHCHGIQITVTIRTTNIAAIGCRGDKKNAGFQTKKRRMFLHLMLPSECGRGPVLWFSGRGAVFPGFIFLVFCHFWPQF